MAHHRIVIETSRQPSGHWRAEVADGTAAWARGLVTSYHQTRKDAYLYLQTEVGAAAKWNSFEFIHHEA